MKCFMALFSARLVLQGGKTGDLHSKSNAKLRGGVKAKGHEKEQGKAG